MDVRRFSSELDDKRNKNDLRTSKTDVRLSAKDIRIQTSNAIGRRLSKDATSWLTSSPPDLNSRRKSHLDITHTKSFSVSDNVLDDPKGTQNDFNNSTKFFTVGPGKYTEYNKELLSKSMVLTPVISKAATLRLASSGTTEAPKPVKTRPRLPSPPPSPVMDFRNSKTPKISISDASCENLNVYDTILPKEEEKKTRSTHTRSKSLDGKHLNFTPTMVEIENVDTQKNNMKAEKQTVNYATLEHKKNNFETEADKAKNVNEKFANIKSTNVSKERQITQEGRSPVGKNVPLPVVDVKKTPVKDFKTIRNNTKDEKNVFDKKQVPPPKVDNLKGTEFKPDPEAMYAEPHKIRKEKKEREEQTTPRKTQVQAKQPEPAAKPKVPPKSNALKQMQTRAYSAPETGFKQSPATILYIPEETLKKKTLPECNYYPERKFHRPETEPSRECTERCFQTFPARTCPYTHPVSHRSRVESDRRFATTERSSSVPEQRYFVTAKPEEQHRKRRTDNPVVILQHSSRSLDTPSKNPGILKNRRRSRSREESELPPAPPSPPERNRGRHERSEAQTNREILLTIKKQGHGYMDPP